MDIQRGQNKLLATDLVGGRLMGKEMRYLKVKKYKGQNIIFDQEALEN